MTGLAGVMDWSRRRQPADHAPRTAVQPSATERPRSEQEALQYLAAHGAPVVPAFLAQDEDAAAARQRGGVGFRSC